MRFSEILVAAAATVTFIPFVRATFPVTGDMYCRAVTQAKLSRCDSNDLCTFGNEMDSKYSCSQLTIDEATRIYQQNVARIRECQELAVFFPEQYSAFLIVELQRTMPVYDIANHFFRNPTNMGILEPILNILLYIPNNILNDQMEWANGVYVEKALQCRDEVGKYIVYVNDHARAWIAVLDLLGVSDYLIQYTLEENLKIGLTELYKYTNLSGYMVFSIEESLHLFALIKGFHEQGLTADPRFPKMQLAIVESLFKHQACLKPEFAVAQNGYYTPVNFSAWSKLIEFIQEHHGADELDPLPQADRIIEELKNMNQGDSTFDNPIMLDILTGLISGATGIEMPPTDHVAGSW